MIVNASGRIEEKMSFDVFGARRNATTWKREHKKISQYTSAITLRGYTGHEQMDEVGLVHMGGRIYDPVLGRFLQADPMIQAPENIQSLNRYSYVMNNPLNKTDPSGYIWVTLVTMALKYIATNTASLILAKAISFALTAYEFYAEVSFYVSVVKALGGNSAEMAQFAGGLAKSYAKSAAINAAIGGALQITGQGNVNKAYEDRMKNLGNAETDMGELTHKRNYTVDEDGYISSPEYAARGMGAGEANPAVIDITTYEMYRKGVLTPKQAFTISNTAGTGAAAMDVVSDEADKARIKVHGNSKHSTKQQHVYIIYDKESGKVHKFGVSSVALNKNGSSPRANSQLSKLGKDKYGADVIATGVKGRRAVLDLERQLVTDYFILNKNRKPVGNIRPEVDHGYISRSKRKK